MGILKATKGKEKVPVNLRVTAEEKAKMQEKADQFCKDEGEEHGNLSEWIRYAATRYEPKPDEVVTDV